MLFNILLIVITYCTMECVAWLTHKYIMHGLLWYLHKDHHQPEEGVFERNDAFFVIFALPCIVLMVLGSIKGIDYRFFIGIGILLYGLSYFMVHDVFIHQRLDWFKRTDSVYLRAIRKGHKMHHKHLGKEDGECFGMLLVPFRYFKEALETKKTN
jgi:beta-carotene 3-hydroxylase